MTPLALAASLSMALVAAVADAPLAERAEAEGALLVNMGPPPYGPMLVAEFAKRYPKIKVTTTMRPPSGEPNVATAFKARAIDVGLACQEPVTTVWVDQGRLADLSQLPNWGRRPRRLEDDPRYVYFLGAPAAVLYNVKAFGDTPLPRSYDDLLDARWRGKIVVRDPANSSAGAFLAHFIRATRGIEWYGKLARNEAIVVNDSEKLRALVRSGERPLALVRDIDSGLLAGGSDDPRNKDLRLHLMTDELPYQYQLAFVAADAPHPSAARLFVDWLLSEQAQELLRREGYSVGPRQSEHLARRRVWTMDARALRPTYGETLSAAATALASKPTRPEARPAARP